jgi:hypothetical protein
MTPKERTERRQMMESVRNACVRAATDGYRNAAMAGLCHEGAWEAAIGAVQMLDLDAILKRHEDTGS